MWVAAAAAVIGGVMGSRSAKKAAKKAKKLARAQAGLIEEETAENLRRMGLEADQVLGMTTARVGASNLMMSGSVKRHRAALEVQMASDMDWVARKGAADAANVRAGGSQIADNIRSRGRADLIGGVGQAIGYMGWGATAPKGSTS